MSKTQLSLRLARAIDTKRSLPGLPVFFNGAGGPRYLGQAVNDHWAASVDQLLHQHMLSAPKVSKAECLGRICIIAHA